MHNVFLKGQRKQKILPVHMENRKDTTEEVISEQVS